MMQSANMGVVPGAMPVQGPGQGPVPVGQGPGPVPVGPPGKLQTALHKVLTCSFLFFWPLQESKHSVSMHYNDVEVIRLLVKMAKKVAVIEPNNYSYSFAKFA